MGDWPAAPWSLTASAALSLVVVPRATVPPAARPVTPAGCRPVVLAGRLLTGVALVRYGPPGDLTYDELVVAVLGRCGLRPVVTVTQIWVDSPASRDGARALWGIPKELAAFGALAAAVPASGPAAAEDGPSALVRVRTRARRWLPGRVRLSFATAQRLDGADHRATHRLSARVGGLRSAWDFNPAGPLGHLARRRPLLTLRLAGTLVFGAVNGEAASRAGAGHDTNGG
ncbi:acetoacetate decarboxylase [Georgenia sp. M64]|uniref:acetoacetate decarboxylase n=1 Tax=Georgenia sp. M64 TaxID=3120520 RepID=UPI0030E34EC5